MDDLISRQAAIDVLEERLQANGYSNVALVSELNRSIGYLMRLPSAQADSKELSFTHKALDTISRQDAIDAVGSMLRRKFGIGGNLAKITLEDLPSAQPEIIWCKDCVHWWESHKMCKRNKDKNHNCACMDCDADFYCKNAERRQDE